MKKKLSILLAVITSVLVLAACGGKQETAAISDEKNTTQDAAASQAVTELDLTGTWEDEVSQRASMDVTKNADGSYQFLVHWGGSATETAIWEMNGTFDEASGTLVYEDGKYSIHTFDENDKETVSGEETTKGSFTLENGKLRWKDSKNSEDGLFSQNKE